MADFTDVLSRAVAGKKTYDERRAVYERARQALVNQLRALDPPLPESDVTRQRLALEESIRKIESEASSLAAAARAAALRRPSETAGAGTPAGPGPGTAGPVAAPPLKAAEPAHNETPAFRPQMPEPPSSPAPASDIFARMPPAQSTAKGPPAPELSVEPRRVPRGDQASESGDDGDPLIAHYDPHVRKVSSGEPAWRRLLMIGLIIVALGVAGAGGVILALRSQGGGAGDTVTQPPVSGAPVKSNDRVGQPATQPAQAPPAQPQAPQSAAAPAGSRTPVAVLYDENAQSTGGVDSYKGAVTWRVDSDSGAQGPERVIRGLIDIPERGLKVLLTIRRNLDQALPASHTVELLFDVPPNFVYGGVESLEQVFMKSAEQANGLPLRGALARITSGYFLIGLSALGPNRENNIGLLRDRPWIDITFLYRSGRRAVLAVGKGEQGEKIFQEVFAQWGG